MSTYRICRMEGLYDVACCDIEASCEYRALQAFKAKLLNDKVVVNTKNLHMEKLGNHWDMHDGRGTRWFALEQIGL